LLPEGFAIIRIHAALVRMQLQPNSSNQRKGLQAMKAAVERGGMA
jgi:hypothetical protein